MAAEHKKTIDYLKKAKGHEQQIKALQELSDRYMEMATQITRRTGPYFSHGERARQRIEDGAVALADLSLELANEAKALAATVQEIRAAIGGIEEKPLQGLLQYRYLNGWTWEQVAEGLDMDVRQVYRVHDRALARIEANRREGER